MAASTQDKITDTRNAARPNSARVSSPRSGGGTTLACDNLAGWPTASKVHFVTYRLDSNSDPVADTQLDCSGIVSGNSIGSVTVIDGTDTGNAVNDAVEMLPTAAWGQDLSDGLLSQHTRAGGHGAITASSITTTDNAAVGGNLAVTGTTALTGTTTITALSNPYKFRVYRNAAASSGNGAFAKITFDTEVFDTNNNFATGTYTVPVAGFYQFNARSQTSGASGNELIIAIYVDGGAYSEGSRAISTNTQGGVIGSTASDLIQLSAGQTVEVYAYSNSTISLEAGSVSGTYFSGFLVSRT